MQNHVISLASAAERRAHIADTSRHDIPFQFFDALMPSERAGTGKMATSAPGLSAHLI